MGSTKNTINLQYRSKRCVEQLWAVLSDSAPLHSSPSFQYRLSCLAIILVPRARLLPPVPFTRNPVKTRRNLHCDSQPLFPHYRAPPKRESHTAAAPAAAPPAAAAAAPPTPVYVPQQQGILGQIATTAAGVATGHVIGRMVTGLFSGGSGAEVEAPAITNANSVVSPTDSLASRPVAPQCAEYSKLFLQCMDQNGNQLSTCQDYMDMMKACQQQHAQ